MFIYFTPLPSPLVNNNCYLKTELLRDGGEFVQKLSQACRGPLPAPLHLPEREINGCFSVLINLLDYRLVFQSPRPAFLCMAEVHSEEHPEVAQQRGLSPPRCPHLKQAHLLNRLKLQRVCIITSLLTKRFSMTDLKALYKRR